MSLLSLSELSDSCFYIVPVLVAALRDEVLLELAEKLEVEEVVGRKRFLANHGLHRLYILADRVACVKLVRHIRMVFSVENSRKF